MNLSDAEICSGFIYLLPFDTSEIVVNVIDLMCQTHVFSENKNI